MKSLYTTLNIAALTVLLFTGTMPGPALADLPVDQLVSQALQGESPALTLPVAQSTEGQPDHDVVQIGSVFGDEGIPPVPEMTLERYRAMDAGSTSTCAIHRKDGHIVCWGLNDFGQANSLRGSYSSLSMGQYHGCAIKKNGSLTCWGLSTAMPQGKQGTGRYRMVSSGDDHTCAIRRNKTAECWGDNSNGELDIPPGKYRDLSARGNHTCAVTTDNQLKCWGESHFVAYTPVSGRFTQVSTGQLHACALRLEDGQPLCWGNNADGQAQPPANERFIHLVSGDYHTCGLRADHSAVCWGRNQFGQINLPSGDYRQISAGGAQSCGLTRRGGHLHCVGSFANNPFLTGQQARQSALPDGMVAPQFAWAVFMPGLTSLFDAATSNTLDILFDKDLNNWQKGGKGASIVFSLLGLVFGEVLPGDNSDPLPPEYKEILQDIQSRVQEMQTTLATVNLRVGETKTAVDKLLCSDTTATIRGAAEYVKSDMQGTQKYGPIYFMSHAMTQYQHVITDMTNTTPNRAKARQDLEEFYKRVSEFKRQWLLGVDNLPKKNDLVTDSLLGRETGKGSPLDACKPATRNEWLAKKPYPFDDRPIWKGGYQALNAGRTTQAAIANLMSQNTGFEFLAAFSGPKFRNDGSIEPDSTPPIENYKPTDANNSQGICEMAEQESGKAGANPRWGRVKDLCEGIQQDARGRYRDHVQISEYMGGAYSDRDMVLSLNAKQMGDAQSSNTGEDNWLWLRNPAVGDFREGGNQKNMGYAVKDDRSPFNGKFTFTDSLGRSRQSDTGVYMTNEDAGGKSSFREGVWHSSQFAWDDLFQAREKIRKEWRLEASYEDVIERMAEETVDPQIEPPCSKNAQGNCEIKRVLQDGVWVDQIVPGKDSHRLFENVRQVPFWRVHTGRFSRDGENGVPFDYYCMGYKAWSKYCDGYANGTGSYSFGGYEFMASGINKAYVVNGKPTGPHWYHPNPTNESTRAYLKMSGRLSSGEEWGAAMINARGHVPGFDCTDESRCVGLGYSIFNSEDFKPYQTAQWFVGDVIKDPPRLLTKWEGWAYTTNYYYSEFMSRARFTHMPVVKISQRHCQNSLIASNDGSVINSGESPKFDRPRSGQRPVDSVTVPSICGRDLDLTIKQTMTRPAHVDIPEIRVIP